MVGWYHMNKKFRTAMNEYQKLKQEYEKVRLQKEILERLNKANKNTLGEQEQKEQQEEQQEEQDQQKENSNKKENKIKEELSELTNINI